MITPDNQLAARIMLRQLNREGLEVSLMPAPDPRHSGHSIRVVENRNPEWYRELCVAHPLNRTTPRQRKAKFTDSLIDRKLVIKALEQIALGKNATLYTRRLLPYVKSFLSKMEANK